MVKPVTRVVKNVASPVHPGRTTRKPAPQVNKDIHRQPHASVRAVNDARNRPVVEKDKINPGKNSPMGRSFV